MASCVYNFWSVLCPPCMIVIHDNTHYPGILHLFPVDVTNVKNKYTLKVFPYSSSHFISVVILNVRIKIHQFIPSPICFICSSCKMKIHNTHWDVFCTSLLLVRNHKLVVTGLLKSAIDLSLMKWQIHRII